MGHTPGPWRLIWWGNERYPFPLSVHTADDTSWIARDGTVSSEANARLIAAAPDLLAAIKELRDYAAEEILRGGAHHDPVWAKAAAAIAKAEGRR